MDHIRRSMSAPVLISGAGPSGMLLALWLLKYSVPFRLVDKATEPSKTSRAIAVHARTLELYRMLGLSDDILRAGTRLEKSVINSNGVRKAELSLSDAGNGQSYYPFVLSITQDEHEAILLQHLERRGGRVERGFEVVGLNISAEESSKDTVEVTLRSTHNDYHEAMHASYVIGCDGAHSGVRHAAGIVMEGGTYSRAFFVADVFYHGDMHTQGEVNTCLAADEFIIVFALPHKENRARVIGFVPNECGNLQNISFEDCRPSIAKCAPNVSIDVSRWFATYRVHHRCATNFQYGQRVFLCGDSAHLHSPLGGQGMNTGLGDVSNLAWKLATAWHSKGGALEEPLEKNRVQRLLSTYSAERQPFAEELVRSNDRLFQTLIDPGFFGWLLRNILLPYVVPFLYRFPAVRYRVFPHLSQIGIEYSKSQLSEGAGRGPALPGHRLPWIEKPGGAVGKADNHSLLDGDGWQLHAFGTNKPLPEHIQNLLRSRKIPIHTFQMTDDAKRKGFVENAVYLIRPDGHIGFAQVVTQDLAEKLETYISDWGVCWLEVNV